MTMDINALREFTAVANEGSFAAAATALAMPKSTVSKRVQDLEAALGVRLIERTTRKLRLTAEGAALLPRAERILADANEAERLVSAASVEPEGALRIRMPHLFAQAFAASIIAECRRAYPHIKLEIVLLDRPVDIMSEGFDGGVYIGSLPDSGQAARTVAHAETIPVASPKLFNTAKTPTHPDQLTKLPALTLTADRQTRWSLSKGGTSLKARVTSVASVNSLTVLHAAATDGVGIAYLPEFLVKADIEKGVLLRLLPDWEGIKAPISFVYPSPHSVTARLRAFIDVLVAHFPDRRLPDILA